MGNARLAGGHCSCACERIRRAFTPLVIFSFSGGIEEEGDEDRGGEERTGADRMLSLAGR